MTLLGKIQDILNLIFRIEKFSVYDQWVRTLHLQCILTKKLSNRKQDTVDVQYFVCITLVYYRTVDWG